MEDVTCHVALAVAHEPGKMGIFRKKTVNLNS